MTEAQRIKELERENELLRQENEKLRKELDAWRRGLNERRKRRTSSPEYKRKKSGRPIGRLAGHAAATREVPEVTGEDVVHPAPTECPCGGSVNATGEQRSTLIEDVPPVRVEVIRHVAPIGRCDRCGETCSAPLPGDTAAGQTIAKTQLGPNLTALITSLRIEHHLPLGQVSKFLRTWMGVRVTTGGISHLLERLARRCEPSYFEICAHVRGAGVVGADETGLRQNGINGWTWIARTDRASLFRTELSRGSWVIESILGNGFCGVLCTDFYAAYTRAQPWTSAFCGAHVIREAKKIAELSATPQTEDFADRVRALYVDARSVQGQGPTATHGIRVRLGRLVADAYFATHPDIARLQRRLDRHFHGVLTFLDRKDVPADNNPTERDLRAFACHRKVTGGTRSRRGSRTLDTHMSITQTLRKNDLSLRDYVTLSQHALLYRLPLPSVFAT